MRAPYVQKVENLGDYNMRLIFSDGLEAILDWRDKLCGARSGGVISALKDPELFARAEPWPEARSIRWPNGADICPDVLREWALQSIRERK